MCEPISAAALALSVASTAASLYGQAQNAEAQGKYQKAQAEEYNRSAQINAQNAIREQNEQSAAERTSQMQQEASASEETQRVQREKAEKMGTMMASAQGAGQSMEFLMADYERAEAQRKDVIRQQLEMVGVNSDFVVKSHRDRASARISTQPRYIAAPIAQPNYLAGALQIGGSAFNTYDKFSDGGKQDLWGVKAWRK